MKQYQYTTTTEMQSRKARRDFKHTHFACTVVRDAVGLLLLLAESGSLANSKAALARNRSKERRFTGKYGARRIASKPKDR